MKKNNVIFFIALVIVSLFLNLALPSLYHEEPRRGLVALEMLFSGNYLVPSIMGEPYYAKPPLFNWVLIASYKLFGSFPEFAVRFPSVLSLLLIGLFHFLFVRKFMNKEIAFYCSMFFITSGNIYFYFSLLGEIDLFYSLIMYLCIISIFYFYQSKRFLLLFLLSFFLGALGFLTKGFPSIVLLYVSLFVFFASERKLKILFSLYHLLGIITFTLILGAYFYFYSLQNSIELYLQFLVSESSVRTVIGKPLYALLKHFIEYPLETLRALLPYSILIIFTFRRGFIKEIFSVPILRFSLLMFISNYLIYLLSPDARQRYIYMLFPFILLVLSYAYFQYGNSDVFRKHVLDTIIRGLLITIAIASVVLPFLNISSMVPYVLFVSVCLFIISLTTLIVSLKHKYATISILLFTIIFGRIAFDMIYLPIQSSSSFFTQNKRNAEKIVEMTRDGRLYLYGDRTLFPDFFGYIFYIERGRGKIIERTQILRRGDYYITKEDSQESADAEKIFSFRNDNRAYGLFKVR